MKVELTIYLLVASVIFSATAIYGQQSVVTYFNKDGGRTADKGEASYTRIVSLAPNPEGLYELNEYYSDNKLKRHGFVKHPDAPLPAFEGIREAYHENGTLKSRETYRDNRLVDTATYYYANGQCKQRIAYIGTKPKRDYVTDHIPDPRLLFFSDSLGKVQVADGAGYATFLCEQGVEKGNYLDGVKTGRWEGTFLKCRCRFEEWYENGELVKGIATDSLSEQHEYTLLEVHPEYPGGVGQLMQFVAKNYRYPPAILNERISGQVILNFKVDTSGRPTDFVIVKDLGHGTGTEAINVMKMSATWRPGYQRGIPVPVAYTIPIRLH